jgi:hypothetical protein
MRLLNAQATGAAATDDNAFAFIFFINIIQGFKRKHAAITANK